MEPPTSTSAPTPPAAPKKKSGPTGMILTVVIAVAAVALLAGYYPKLMSFWLLKPWDKAGPAEAVDGFAAALKANDVTALQALSIEGFEFGQDGGKITTVKSPGAALRPPTDVARVTPSASAKGAEMEYEYHEKRRGVVLTVTEPDGRKIRFKVVPQKGKWLVSGVDG